MIYINDIDNIFNKLDLIRITPQSDNDCTFVYNHLSITDNRYIKWINRDVYILAENGTGIIIRKNDTTIFFSFNDTDKLSDYLKKHSQDIFINGMYMVTNNNNKYLDYLFSFYQNKLYYNEKIIYIENNFPYKYNIVYKSHLCITLVYDWDKSCVIIDDKHQFSNIESLLNYLSVYIPEFVTVLREIKLNKLLNE